MGAFASEEEARNKLSGNLQYSTYHGLTAMEADGEAGEAELQEEEVDDADWGGHGDGGEGKGGEGKGGKRWGKGEKGEKGGGKGWQRWEPYEASSSLATRPAPRTSMGNLGHVVAAISKAEAAARTAGRMASAAAHAFNEEAMVLRDALDALNRSA